MATSEHTAMLTGWVTGGLALFILLVRLGVQPLLSSSFLDATVYAVALAVFVLGARLGCNYYILQYGTVSELIDSTGTASYTALQLSHARIGSILTLVARLLITTYYWLQCIILLLVYHRFVGHFPVFKKLILLCWVLIAVTYVAVALATFLECNPFSLYTAISLPSCAAAYAQLLTQCISNIAIDLLLLAISTPILREQRRVFPRNLQLGTIFILGFFCIIVNCLRLRYVFASHSAQVVRSLWASIQALVATVVANAPSIYGAARVSNRKRRNDSATSSSTPIFLDPVYSHQVTPK